MSFVKIPGKSSQARYTAGEADCRTTYQLPAPTPQRAPTAPCWSHLYKRGTEGPLGLTRGRKARKRKLIRLGPAANLYETQESTTAAASARPATRVDRNSRARDSLSRFSLPCHVSRSFVTYHADDVAHGGGMGAEPAPFRRLIVVKKWPAHVPTRRAVGAQHAVSCGGFDVAYVKRSLLDPIGKRRK